MCLKDSDLRDFIKIRVVVVYTFLIIVSLIFFSDRWYIVMGLTCGSIFGIMKYKATAKFISNILLQGEKTQYLKVFTKFLSLQAVTVLLMAVSIRINMWSFYGTAAGLLLIPAIITVNSLTEALGISHNNFQ